MWDAYTQTEQGFELVRGGLQDREHALEIAGRAARKMDRACAHVQVAGTPIPDAELGKKVRRILSMLGRHVSQMDVDYMLRNYIRRAPEVVDQIVWFVRNNDGCTMTDLGRHLHAEGLATSKQNGRYMAGAYTVQSGAHIAGILVDDTKPGMPRRLFWIGEHD